MNGKKAMVESTLGKIILSLIVLAVLFAILVLLKDKMGELWQRMTAIFRYGV